MAEKEVETGKPLERKYQTKFSHFKRVLPDYVDERMAKVAAKRESGT